MLASAVLVVLLVWDVFVTVLSGKGAGPLSSRWYRLVWGGLLIVHARRPIHSVLSFAGPFMLIASIVLWYVLLVAALFLALAAFHGSVVNNLTGDPAAGLDLAYFVTSTTSSLGYGDRVPSGFPWTIASTTATLAGTVILTISLSYVLAVLSAAIERRKLARGIFGLGETTREMIETATQSEGRETLNALVLDLVSQIDHQALKLLAYPVLKYFHSTRQELSLARALLAASDATFVLGLMPADTRPAQWVLGMLDSSVDKYVALGNSVESSGCGSTQDMGGLREVAHGLGLAHAFEDTWGAYRPRRRRLLEMCRADGWRESTASQPAAPTAA